MSGYTKLFSSIVHSTIWREKDHIRIVWVTLLAMSDKDGVIEASVPGLADAARVSLSDCVEALERLKSPDEYSRTPDNEGRRIEEIDGGWEILNYVKYREMASIEERRRRSAIRQKRWRDRKKNSNAPSRTVTHSNAPSRTVMKNNDNAEADAEADAYTNAYTEKRENTPKPPKGATADFERFWDAYDHKVGKQAAIKAYNKAKKNGLPGIDELVGIIGVQKAQREKNRRDGMFVPEWPLATTWLNQGRWEDEIKGKEMPKFTDDEIPF
jgi:hypothetical protein